MPTDDYDPNDPESWPEEEPPENPFEEPPPPLDEGAIREQPDEERTDDRKTALVKFLRGHLLTTDQLDSIPEPQPIIGEEHLFIDTLNWLVGKPGHGKSFVALDLAGCIGTGMSWHGYGVRQGRVLYIAAEGVRGVRRRVRAWERKHGQRMTGVDFLPFPVQSTNGSHWDALVTMAAEARYTLIVVDTQARVTVGVEENSNKEMGTFVHQAERLRERSGACTLLVHHVGAGGERGRGATTLDGALTTIMRAEKREGGLVVLDCQKNKDAAEWPSIEFQLVPSGDSVVLVSTANIGTGASLMRAVQDDVMLTARRWWEHYRDEWQTAKSLEEVTGRAKSTFARHRQDLTQFRYAESTGGRAPKYRLTGDPEIAPDQRPVPESEVSRPPEPEALF
jgi:RecA-family ATPase